jgi:hypothetical protein
MNPFYTSPGFGEISIFEDGLNGVKISRADRLPCPVCGHPTGDCTGDSAPLSPEKVWGYNTNSSLDDSVSYYFEEDYVEEREIAPGIITKVVIHKRGKNIPLSEAKKLGLVK